MNLCYFSVYSTFTNFPCASYPPFSSLLLFVHIFRLIIMDFLSVSFILCNWFSWKSAVRIRSVKKCFSCLYKRPALTFMSSIDANYKAAR